MTNSWNVTNTFNKAVIHVGTYCSIVVAAKETSSDNDAYIFVGWLIISIVCYITALEVSRTGGVSRWWTKTGVVLAHITAFLFALGAIMGMLK